MDNININQLRYFIEVSKHENFTKAAESLHVSQPTITSAIKAFEQEIGFQVFSRTKSHVVLTEEGEQMLELTKRFLDKHGNFIKEAHDIGSPNKTVLKIGIPPIIGALIFKAIVPAFEADNSSVKLNIEEIPTLTGLELLKEGTIDFLFGNANETPSCCNSIKVRETKLSLFISPQNPIANNKCVSLKQLANQPFIVLPKGSSLNKRMETMFDGIPINIVLYTNQLSIIRYMVENNLAMVILYEYAFEPNDNIVKMDIEEAFVTNIRMLWKKSIYMSDAMNSFIKFAKKIDF